MMDKPSRAATAPDGTIAAVFFDVDGVLLDSLAPHLQISADKSRQYGLSLAIPDARSFKDLVRRGVVISPMKYFFTAVGFPNDLAERADADYQREFAHKYGPKPFPGVDLMLSQIASAGLSLGFVTANTLSNVASGLGGLMKHFHPKCRFTKDDPRGLSKPEALLAGAAEQGIAPQNVIYVGDQPRDAEAAREAGTQFLGVTYGWGIGDEDTHFPLVTSPAEVARYVIERRTRKS
jgi:phosphoglycolate phosphatase